MIEQRPLDLCSTQPHVVMFWFKAVKAQTLIWRTISRKGEWMGPGQTSDCYAQTYHPRLWLVRRQSNSRKTFKEAQFYQYQVDRLHKEINRPKMQVSLKLDEFSSFLYSRASKIEHDLLKSDIFLSYTKLFIIHHLRNTSILEKEDWIMNLRHHQIWI